MRATPAAIDTAVSRAPPPPRRGLAPRLSLGPTIVVDMGTLPRPTYGAGARVGVKVGRSALELGVLASASASATVSGTIPPAGGSFHFWSASLSACPAFAVRRFDLGACAEIEGVEVKGTGFGVSSGYENDARWLRSRGGSDRAPENHPARRDPVAGRRRCPPWPPYVRPQGGAGGTRPDLQPFSRGRARVFGRGYRFLKAPIMDSSRTGHSALRMDSSVSMAARESGSAGSGASAPLTLADIYREHFDFVWRSLRRMGVAPGIHGRCRSGCVPGRPSQARQLPAAIVGQDVAVRHRGARGARPPSI